ncbi:MAG: ABC transporter ATP-binding protein [Acidimicrobiales bacterium]
MTDIGSPYVPVGVDARYRPPHAQVHPDRTKSWWARALPFVLAHKGIFGTSLGLSFAALVIQVRIPELVRRAIDSALVARETGLGGYVWWIVGLAVARGVMGYVARRYLFETAYAIEYDLRNTIYEHLTRLSFSFYDRVQTGQLISRANSDIRAVQMYLTFAPAILVQCGIAVVAFVQMVTISVPLALVSMATMPVVVWAGIRMRRDLFPVSWLVQSRLAEVATIVDENVNGVRVVKAFAAEQTQVSTLARAAQRVQWANICDADIRARWSPTVENLPRLGLALVLLYGGWLVIDGQTTVGTIVAFNAYVLMLQPPFRLMGLIVMLGQRAAASAKRIFEILDEQPEIVDRPGAYDLIDCEGEVHFENVSFAYANGLPVLDGFDLRLRPGETVALVGPTGAGKSTVARLLTRFYDVTNGALRIDGHDVRNLTVASLRAQVGLVLDDPFLFSVPIRDNIAYGRPDASLDEVVAAATAAGAHRFISNLPNGYDSVIGERGYTLSGGQRQRLAIARTLLMNPPILVLDDATSSIDVKVEQQIHDALRTLMRGRTTLIIAHRLSTISLADRVVLLSDGRVAADGTHAELLVTSSLYADVLAQGEERDRLAAEAQARVEADEHEEARPPVDGLVTAWKDDPFPGVGGGS